MKQILVAAVWVLASATLAWGQPPCSNIINIAQCGTPTPVTLAGGGVWANNTGCLYPTPGLEQIYTFTPTVTGNYSIIVTATNGQWIDYFYKPASLGCTDSNWICIDDVLNPSTVGNFALTAGVQYYFLLDPEGVATATHTFQISCPPQDPCTNIQPIAACGTPVTATLSGGGFGWNITTCGFNTPGAERIYSYTPPVSGNYNFQVTAAAGGYIDYYWRNANTGCDTAGWTCIDDWNAPNISPVLPLLAGNTYYFLLDAEGVGTMTHTFQIVCAPPPPTNPCTNVLNIPACGTNTSVSLLASNGLWNLTACAGGTTPGREQLYTFTPTGSGDYQFSTTAANGQARYFFKPVAAGCDTSNFTCIGTIGAAGNIGGLVTLTGGIQYYILVDAVNPNAITNHTFRINCLASDPCNSILPLACGTPTTVALNPGTGLWGNAFCGYGLPGREQIYTFTPPTTGSYELVVTAAAGGWMDYGYKPVTGGCSDGGFTCIDDIIGPGTFGPFTLTGGTPYYILVDAEATNLMTQTFQIRPIQASIAYTGSPYCQAAGINPTPTVTGNPGGTFSATPAGLAINPNTGQISLAISNLGTYLVTYTPAGGCGLADTATVIINNTGNASFTYPGIALCQNSGLISPIITGTPGGTFSATPAGLVFNSSTGVIDAGVSSVGAYTVTYTVTGACAATANQPVQIVPSDTANILYPANTVCQGSPLQTPTLTGLAGGTYTATPAGLSLVDSTGVVNPANSQPGTYIITYTTDGPCPAQSQFGMVVTPLSSALFVYPGIGFCQNDTNPTPTLVGATGGIFSSTAGLVIDPITGTLDLANSTPGAYNVMYATGGGCPDTVIRAVQIIGAGNPAFAYASPTLCQGSGSAAPTVTGTPNGLFSSSPAGLTINAATGLINLNTSMVGTYAVTYSTQGACAADSTVQIIIATPDAPTTVFFTAVTYCDTATNPTPMLIGTPGGTFFGSFGLVVDSNTGTVDLGSSAPGIHTITYISPGPCPVSVLAEIAIEECAVGRADATPAAALHIWPNPVLGREVYLQPTTTGPITFTLSDLQGRTLLTRTLTATAGQALRVELPEVAAGTYLARIASPGNAASTFRLVVVR